MSITTTVHSSFLFPSESNPITNKEYQLIQNKMKKLVITIAIILGTAVAAPAQYFNGNGQPNGGGLFGRGNIPESANVQSESGTPLLPVHGQTENQDAPLGSGALLLIGFGAAYALSKKSKN